MHTVNFSPKHLFTPEEVNPQKGKLFPLSKERDVLQIAAGAAFAVGLATGSAW